VAARGDSGRLGAVWDDLKEWGAALVHLGWQTLWTLLAGAMGGCFSTAEQGGGKSAEVGGMAYATTFGTPMVLMSFSLAVTLHIG